MTGIVNNAMKALNKNSSLTEIKTALSNAIEEANITVSEKRWNEFMDDILYRLAIEEPNLTTIHLDNICTALAGEDGIKVADTYNKLALETKAISLYAYREAARLIVDARLAMIVDTPTTKKVEFMVEEGVSFDSDMEYTIVESYYPDDYTPGYDIYQVETDDIRNIRVTFPNGIEYEADQVVDFKKGNETCYYVSIWNPVED